MKKINALLHDVTVIHFIHVAKLALRYRIASFIALALVVISVSWLYFTQVTIHTKKVYFKITMKEDAAGGGKPDFSDLIGGTTSAVGMNPTEAQAMVTNYDFTYALAQNLVDSPHLTKFNFNSPSNKISRTQEEIFEHCDDRTCNIKTIQSFITGFYAIEPEQGTARFILTVTTRSPITTLEIVRSFKKTLEESRLKLALSSIEAEIQQVNELITKSRNDIESKGGFTKVASSESIEAVIQQQNEKIRGINARLNSEDDKHQFQQIRLKESTITANQNIEGDSKLQYEKFNKLNKSIELLRQNIGHINSIPLANRTPTDQKILEQLRLELAQNEADLKKMGQIKRNIAFDNNFINSQIDNQSTFEFDYKITASKVKRLQQEHDIAKKELDVLFAQKAELENELMTLRPDLEYLKMMESKLVQLKMEKSAIKSDATFDQFGAEVSSFKRNSLLQIIIFSVMINAFILFIALIFIYLFDDRIYDEYEIARCCDNIPIIGKAPTFEP